MLAPAELTGHSPLGSTERKRRTAISTNFEMKAESFFAAQIAFLDNTLNPLVP
jgi:hypothetical protein